MERRDKKKRERRQLTGGLFNHEIRLSDEKQEEIETETVGEPRVRKKHRRLMKNAFQMPFRCF